MLDDVTKIIKSNKKIEELFEIEDEITEIKRKLNDIDDLEEDNGKYDKLMCEVSAKEMKMKYLKEKLDKDGLELFENIKIFLKYNKITAKIKEIEKRSKKSNNVVLTENSEGRKKEIDRNLVDFYNICVEKKKKLSKDFTKAIKFLENYKPKKEEKIVEPKKETKRMENENNYVGIANIRYNSKTIEEDEEEVKEEKKKVSFLNKAKKYAVGFVVGVAAIASVIAFGGTKEEKTVKNNVSIEKEADVKDEEKETKVEVTIEKQIDNIIAEEEKIKEIDENTEVTDEIITDVTVEIENPALGDNLNVSDTSKIMCNQYDATNYENGKHPYYSNTEQRTIEGIVYKLPDGTIKTARTDAEISKYSSIDGAEVTAYLTYSKYGVEGFYSIHDVVLDNSKTLTKKL